MFDTIKKILGGTSFAVESRGKSITVDMSVLSDDILARAAIHGIKQKVADAAAGAKKLAEAEDETRDADEIAVDLMTKAATRLANGDWGAERSGGAGLSEFERECVSVARSQAKGQINGYGGMKPAERDRAVWDWINETPERAKKVEKVTREIIERRNLLGDL